VQGEASSSALSTRTATVNTPFQIVVCSSFLVVVSLVGLTPGQAPVTASEFARFPGESPLNGRPAKPQMLLARARQFRTVLTLDAEKGPNFNGHYRATHWGCGSNCMEWAVIDLIDGRVWFASERVQSCWAPNEASDVEYPPRIEVQVDSRLLYLTDCSTAAAGSALIARQSVDRRQVFEWQKGAPVLLRSEPLAPR
jgi:hypothetical protein